MKPCLALAPSLFAVACFASSLSAEGACSYDQERVFRQETPYSLMTDASNATTLAATATAWATENKSGMRNPAWVLIWTLAAVTGNLDGPECSEIPAAYFDGVAVAEDKTALPLDSTAHFRILKKFARVHLTNLAIIAGAMYDNNTPVTFTALTVAALSPVITYGLHEWWTITNHRRWRSSVKPASFDLTPTFAASPELLSGDTHLRVIVGVRLTLLGN